MIDTSTMSPPEVEAAAIAYLAGDDVQAVFAQIAAFATAGLSNTSRIAQPLGFAATTTGQLGALAKSLANPLAPTLDQQKAARGAQVGALLNSRIADGLLVNGLHVQIDDGARGNLIGLVTMATLVAQGVTTWPAGYSRGWVTAEGPRIPLPTPQDGVQLALAASAYYSGLVQHAQDLVDAIKAAADAVALAAIDITEGWPSAA